MSPSANAATALRLQVEESLAPRIASALTPAVRLGRERNSSGIEPLDRALQGGVPVGAITELVGEECSGRTTMALAYVAASLQAGNVAAWIDVDDVLDPCSAAMSGVDCDRLLWVRCAPTQMPARVTEPSAATLTANKPSHTAPAVPVPPANGGSPHPRSEGRGMDRAIQDLLVAQPRSGATSRSRRVKPGTPSAPNRPLSGPSDREEQIASDRLPSRRAASMAQSNPAAATSQPGSNRKTRQRPALSARVPNLRSCMKHEWSALDKALRATDMILQAGGFSLIVLDLGSTPAEMSWRIPLASWFRFRAACDRTRTSLLLLTRHPCAKSSAELILRMQPGAIQAEGGVLTGIAFHSDVERVRFQHAHGEVLPFRKPPQPVRAGHWTGRTSWAV